MKLICSTIHPECCIVLLIADRKEWYCSSATRLTLTTVLVGDVGHTFEFHQADHPRFGFRGHFECNTVRSLVPKSILCKLFKWKPFPASFFVFLLAGVRGRLISLSLVVFQIVYSTQWSKTLGNSKEPLSGGQTWEFCMYDTPTSVVCHRVKFWEGLTGVLDVVQ